MAWPQDTRLTACSASNRLRRVPQSSKRQLYVPRDRKPESNGMRLTRCLNVRSLVEAVACKREDVREGGGEMTAGEQLQGSKKAGAGGLHTFQITSNVELFFSNAQSTSSSAKHCQLGVEEVREAAGREML